MAFKQALDKQRRTRRRVELVGTEGVNIQDARRRKAKTPKAITRDVQKRMGEFKRGKVIDKVKRFKNPLNK